jgi:hypothetical protein
VKKLIEIQIAGSKKSIDEDYESWVNQQINNRRKDGQIICVRVFIKEEQINLILSSRECPSIGGSRPLHAKEKAIVDLWNKYRLNTSDFHGGNLIAFLKQVRRYL